MIDTTNQKGFNIFPKLSQVVDVSKWKQMSLANPGG